MIQLLFTVYIAIVMNFSPGPVDFQSKMEDYWNQDFIVTIVDLSPHGSNWLGATLGYLNQYGTYGCTNKVFLDDRFANKEGELWKGVLAHEFGHVTQGENCASEYEANVRALQSLWRIDEKIAWLTWVDFLVNSHGWSRETAEGIK